MKLFQITFALSLLLSTPVFSQNPDANFNCASEEAMTQYYLSHPEKIAAQEMLDKEIYNRMAANFFAPAPPYTLPVVVHVIHQNGAENISDAQIELAIEQLNEAFAHTGYYGAKGDGYDTQVQFCMAKQDPDGNASNGITRHVSPLTNLVLETEDISMKDIARWEPLDYINIYVVNEISSISAGTGVLGYAYLATSHGMPEDGIVCEASFFGTTPSENAVLIHEMGHYLNLYHTFDGGCLNNDCLSNGDRVCDTPPDQATLTTCINNSCATDLDDTSANNPLTTDEDDPTENYMDYSPFNCYHAFTPGQAERMYATIDLIRFSLLDSEACNSLCTIPISIDFTSSATEIFTGETVNFTNNSSGATSYEWSVDGVPFSTTADASFTFNNVGTFEVELFINNADVNCVETLSVIIQVNCSVDAGFTASGLTIDEGDPFLATNSSLNASGYEWYINGVLTSTDVDLTFVFSNAGIYTLLLVATNGECADQIFILINVTPDNPCPNPPCAEICDNGIDDDGDGYTDCFDEDCACSDGTDCSGDVPVNNFDSELEWRSTNEDASSLATPMVANLDPQNGLMPEIIVGRGSANIPNLNTSTMLIFNGDGSNQEDPVKLVVEGGIAVNPVSPPAIGDIDGNGIPEVIIVCGDDRLRAYTNYDPNVEPAMELWAISTELTIEKRAIPTLADFNGDGIAEVLVGNDIFQFDLTNPAAPALTKVLDGTGDYGKIGWAYDLPATNGSSISTAVDLLTVIDCAGDPDCSGVEVIAGKHIYSVDLDPFDGDGLEIKIQRDLNQMNPGSNFVDGYTSSADVNLDGVLDVIVSSSRDFELGVYAWDKNGLIAFFPFPPPPAGENSSYVGAPAVANVYDDTVDGFTQDFPEIICVSSYRLTAFNLNVHSVNPAQPYQWEILTDDNSGYTGATVFDFNGDGLDEICYRDTELLRIMYGGPAPFPPGVGPDRNWTTEPCFSPTFGEAPVVADCDADGEAELIYTGKISTENLFTYTQGHLWVLGSGDQSWVSSRSVWNQYGYFGVNVNDDLTIPANQQLHQLEFPSLGSGNRPFNQFMAQMPILDNSFNPFYPVPDATVLVDSSQCEGDSIRVWLTVCNEGSNGLPADMPIVFYDGDPLVSAALALGLPVELGTNLISGACANVEVLIPGIYNTPIYVATNVKLSLPTPYDPAIDFPVTEIVECDYANNFGSFTEQAGLVPPPDLGPDIVLCGSSIVVLDAGSPYDSYQWPDGSDEQIFTVFSAGLYWINVQAGCGPVLSDTIEISFDQFSTFDLGPDLLICIGDSIELTTSGFSEITWFPEEGLDCTNCQSVTASPDSTTTYYATGQSGDCVFTDSIQISIEEIELALVPDTLTCTDSIGQISVSANIPDVNYSWSGPAGFIASESTTSVTLPGDYTVTVTSTTGGCGAIETITVLADTIAPIVDISSFNTTILCDETSTTLDASGSSQGGAFIYAWSPVTNISAGATTLTPQVDQAGNYLLTIANQENGCIASDEVEITAEETPVIIDLEILPVICNGESSGSIEILQVESGTPPYSYSLNGQPFIQSTLFDNLASGNYFLEVVDANGCQSETIIEFTEPDSLFVTLTGDTIAKSGDVVLISATIAPPETVLIEISWEPNTTDTALDVDALITDETLFTITVTDTAGCMATDELLILLENSIYFPNIINPNSPNNNRLFTGFGRKEGSIIRTLKVFDRWGGIVFQGENLPTNDTSAGWDGTARGELVNQGIYAFFAVVEFSNGEVVQVNGEVMVVK